MKREQFKINNKTLLIILFLIFFLALFLRLYNIEYKQFEGDDIKDLRTVNKILSGNRPLFKEGTHGFTGPLYYYILTGIGLISREPLFFSIIFCIINSITIFILFKLLNKIYGNIPAIIGTLFYTVNPWLINYSGHELSHALIPLLSILLIYFLHETFIEKKKKNIIVILFILGILMQLNYSTIPAIIIFIPIIFLMNYKQIKIKYLITGFIIFLILFSPFLIFLLKENKSVFNLIDEKLIIKENVDNFELRENNIIYSFIYKISYKTNIHLYTPLLFLNSMTTNKINQTFYKDFLINKNSLFKTINNISNLLGLILIIYSIYYFSKKRNKFHNLILIYLISGLVSFFIIRRNEIIMLHIFHLSPILFILISNTTKHILKQKITIKKIIFIIIIIIILSNQIFYSILIKNYMKRDCIKSPYNILNFEEIPSYKTYKTCVLNKAIYETNSTKIQQTCCKCQGCYDMPFKTIWLAELIMSANS